MHKQAGVTIPSALILLLLGLLFIKAVISLVPIFWDDRMLNTVLTQLQDSGEYKKSTANQVFRSLEGSLQRNNLNISLENLSITPVGQGFLIEWDYERRTRWVGKVDFVVAFSHSKELN